MNVLVGLVVIIPLIWLLEKLIPWDKYDIDGPWDKGAMIIAIFTITFCAAGSFLFAADLVGHFIISMF